MLWDAVGGAIILISDAPNRISQVHQDLGEVISLLELR
jgi:hypothetical protein